MKKQVEIQKPKEKVREYYVRFQQGLFDPEAILNRRVFKWLVHRAGLFVHLPDENGIMRISNRVCDNPDCRCEGYDFSYPQVVV